MRSMAWLLIIMMAIQMDCMGLDFDMKTFSSDNISFWQDSSIASNVISLTTESRNGNSVGRVLYNEPIPLWANVNDSRWRASFHTSFLFRILSTNFSENGDGMAFLISGEHTRAPNNSTSDGLGILDRSLNGQASNNIIAVEFDTFKDKKYGDVDYNHVGIDVNSLNSTTKRSLYDISIELGRDVNLTAWIDYDENSMILSVYVASLPFSKPLLPFISQLIDLSLYLPQDIFIGFSAGTYSFVEFHEIYSWQFNITDPPSLAVTPTPTSAPAPSLYVPAPTTIDNSSPPTTDGVGSTLPVEAIVGIALALFSIFLLLTAIIFVIWRKLNGEQKPGVVEIPASVGLRRFTYQEIREATNNFSEANRLGGGGFGPVHKGILPRSRTPVAIKSIGRYSRQGEKEFNAEVNIIGEIQHKNILPLHGCCRENNEFFLVYEYMPNGSLDQHLYNADISKIPLKWSQRQKIVCGLAEGLQYLHDGWEKQVIHRDVKSANVMLDQNFNARLGDFGLARLADHNQMIQTTIAAGTLGYLAPEAISGNPTSASDVFSFGVVALEVASGLSVGKYITTNSGEVQLVDWVRDLYFKGMLFQAADPRLARNYNPQEMERMLCLGLACTNEELRTRPNMKEVHECLSDYGSPIPRISERMSTPRFYAQSSFAAPGTTSASMSSDSNYNISATLSSSSARRFEPGPR